MIVVYNVLVSDHLRIIRQVRDTVDHGVDEIPTALLECLHPVVTRFRGESFVEDRDEVLSVFRPLRHRLEPRVSQHLLDTQHFTEVRPVAILLRHSQANPLAIATLVVVPQRAWRRRPRHALELSAQDRHAGDVQPLQGGHAAQV